MIKSREEDMKTIGLLKEPEYETRVSLLPAQVASLTKENEVEVLFEPGLGRHISISNMEYLKAGAQAASSADIYAKSDILLSFNSVYEGQKIKQDAIFLGVYNMLYHHLRIAAYEGSSATVYSLDLLRRSTVGQRMDVLSSMASLSGYRAVISAANSMSSAIPMFTTAAGTLQPAKVLVLGAGVAGLQAIATAKRMGAIVSAFDVRAASRQEVESLGARFIEVTGAADSDSSGGYAIEQNHEYEKRQKALIHERAIESSIIITTANVPGQQAPLLLEENTVAQMKSGSVIIDLAAEQGGNCALTVDGKEVLHHGVHIIGNSHLSRQIPQAASQLLSNNFHAFLVHLLNADLEKDELTKDCMVLHKSGVVHPRLVAKTMAA